jgi:hypothetical protein
MNNDFNVDFTFEILKGCKWNCSGCNVDKQIQNDIDQNNIDSLLTFFDDLENHHYVLVNFNLGPTDLFESVNMTEALLAAKILSKRFKAVTINSTFLGDHDYKELAKQIDNTFPGLPLKLTVPIEPDHILKDKYRTVIKNNLDEFVSALQEAKYQKTYLVCNLDQYHAIETEFRKYSERFEQLTNNHLNIFVTEGRLNIELDFHRDKLVDALVYYNNLYNNHIKQQSDIGIIDFTYANEHEGHDWDLFYRNGNIYFPPFIGEPLATFHDYFCLGTKEKWTANDLFNLRQEMMIECLDYIQDKECNDCQFLSMCSARRMPNLMKLLGRADCLAPKTAFIIHSKQVEIGDDNS